MGGKVERVPGSFESSLSLWVSSLKSLCAKNAKCICVWYVWDVRDVLEGPGGWIGDVLYSSFISVPFLLWTLMNGWMWGWLVLVLILVFAPCWESGLNFDSWMGVCGFDDYTYQLHLQQALIGETGLHNACVYHSWLSMPHWQPHRRCLFVQGKITSYISPSTLLMLKQPWK